MVDNGKAELSACALARPNRLTLQARPSRFDQITIQHPGLLVPVTAGARRLRYTNCEPHQGNIDRLTWYAAREGFAVLPTPGRWYLYLDEVAVQDFIVLEFPDTAALLAYMIANGMRLPVDLLAWGGTDVTAGATPPFNVAQIGGTAQTGADLTPVQQAIRDRLPAAFEGTSPGEKIKVSAATRGTLRDITETVLGVSATFTGVSFGVLIDAAGVAITAVAHGSGHGIELAMASFANVAGTQRFLGALTPAGTFRTLQDTVVGVSTLTQTARDYRGLISARMDYVNGGSAQGTFEHVGQYFGQA